GYRLLSIHNVQFLKDLMSEIRDAIKNDTFYELKERVYKEYGIEDGKDF
ncbi:MAG TPA: tRNA guanosine(34) transglycosylase Tgt, partial [Bacilli bacterium]|nr:tRNA guanosine(34) transglycosylase Tgt [Bacilli bacterium]